MAQGVNKKKSSAKKPKTQKKAMGPRKGGRAIAPKKSKKQLAGKVKKNLEKAINQTIEEQTVAKAKSNEAKSLNVLKVTASTKAPAKGKSKKKGKK